MREVERSGEADTRAVRVTREVMRVAFKLARARAEVTLHGEEDVTTLPAPVQAVEIGIKGMAGGRLRRVAGVRLRVGANVETQRAIGTLRHAFEADHRAPLLRIHPSVLPWQLDPHAILALKRETAQQIAEPGEGESLPRRCLIAQRIQQQRAVAEGVPHGNLQHRAECPRSREQQCEDGREFIMQVSHEGRYAVSQTISEYNLLALPVIDDDG